MPFLPILAHPSANSRPSPEKLKSLSWHIGYFQNDDIHQKKPSAKNLESRILKNADLLVVICIGLILWPRGGFGAVENP